MLAVLHTPRWRGHIFRLLAWTLAGFVAAWSEMSAASPPLTPRPIEYQLKAVFLFNFAHFVEWPADAFADAAAPLVIGVLGEDPFGPYLQEAIAGETANQRPLILKQFREVEEVTGCHILFISNSEAPRLDRILAVLDGKSILTVGDSEAFARRGGVIRFRSDGNRIRFVVNLASARAARLTISSKLLRTAEVIPAETTPR